MLTAKTLDQVFDRAVQAAGAEADAAGERLAVQLRTALDPPARQLDQASVNVLLGALALGLCIVTAAMIVTWK